MNAPGSQKNPVHAAKWLAGLLCGALFAALAYSGLLRTPSNAVNDALYQRPQAAFGDIVIVGIDEAAIEAYGPLPWSRDIYAAAIDYLNARPETRPAVIGVDVIFLGESDPVSDAALADAAARHGNVVVAKAAVFSTAVIESTDNGTTLDSFHVESVNAPYPALANATAQGHINAMADTDGILRHAMLAVDLPDGTQLPAFHRAIAGRYAAGQGMSLAMPPTQGRNFWYLPYTGLPGAYSDGISIRELVEGTVQPELFAGKIVLIGPYAAGLMDQYPTAVDHARPMYGVEVQANAVEALLRGDFKTEAPLWPQVLALFAASAGCFWWMWDRKPLWAGLSLVLAAGGWLGACLLAYRQGLVLQALWVPLAAAVIYMATVAVNYIRAALEKRRVTNTFKRYVAPEVVNEILKQGPAALELGGKLADIAVLFVDIRGFTPMSELLEPPRLVEILNRYLTLTSTCILQNKGTLDKFVGDATMAIWGAPLPQEDHVYLAVKAARDMVEASAALNRELEEAYGRTVGFGVGVHCGPAVVGNIGAKIRMDYTAIGDTVNTAARLEANAPSGRVYLSRAVADALGERIRTTSLGGSVKLKGKTEGFEVLMLDELL